MRFILLIDVKMPTIVGILTFISMINRTSERHKASNFFICRYCNIYRAVKISCSVELSMKNAFTKFNRPLSDLYFRKIEKSLDEGVGEGGSEVGWCGGIQSFDLY